MSCSKCGADNPQGVVACQFCGNSLSTNEVSSAGSLISSTGASLDINVASALAYLFGFISGILFLVIEPYKNNKTVRFHAFQSIFFSVAYVVYQIVYEFFVGFFSFSYNLSKMLDRINIGVSCLYFFMLVFVAVKAYKNIKTSIPVIGELADKQAG